MPDFVKPVNRSKANAIINIMGGFGAIVAYTMGLVSDSIGLPIIFIITSGIMILAMLVLFFKVDENKAYSYKLLLEMESKEDTKSSEKKKKVGLITSFKDILKEEDKSTLFILFAIFAWFIGYQGLEALFSIYAGSGPNGVLDQSTGFSGFLFNFVAIPFILAAYPLSLVASKIGRRRSIQIGLILMISSMVVGFLIQTLTVTMIILVIFGIGWAFVNVNSIVIVWELAPSVEKIGTYTGVYYFFSVLAAIIGPGIVGGLRDLLGKNSLLLVGAIFIIIAFVFMLFVKRGEVAQTGEEKLVRQKKIAEL
jgi:MFS family permease